MTQKKRSSESGQATVEFALAIFLMMGMILFQLQFALVSAYGSFVQYATFMSARAYLASGYDDQDQKDRAKEVLVRMLKHSVGQPGRERWPLIAEGQGGDDVVKGAKIGGGASEFQNASGDLSWMVGVRYTFKSSLFLVPFGGSKDVNSLTLTSESWLGQEVTYSGCIEDLKERDAVFIDNGC